MRVAFAIAASLLAHALVALAAAFCLSAASEPETIATLDVSSVELSFAETDKEAAPAIAASALEDVPPAASEMQPKSSAPQPPPPDLRQIDADPRSLVRHEPEDSPEKFKTPPSQPKQASAAEAPRQAKIDAPPKPRKAIKPDYPNGARKRGEEGRVVLEIFVGSDGPVGNVKVVSSSGFAELDEASVRAAKGARFTPAKSGGGSVASTARLTLEFKLR